MRAAFGGKTSTGRENCEGFGSKQKDGIRRDGGRERDWWRRRRRRGMILGSFEAHKPTGANTCRVLFPCICYQPRVLYSGPVNHSRRPLRSFTAKTDDGKGAELLKAEMSALNKRLRRTRSVSVWKGLRGV